MPRKRIVGVNVLPNEILFPGSKIIVESSQPLDAKSAQGGIIIRGQRGHVGFSLGNKRMTWSPQTALPPGRHTLTLGTFVTKKGRAVRESQEIPFFVTDSKAKIPANVRVESMVRFRPSLLKTERLPFDRRRFGRYVEIMKATNRKTGKPVELAFDQFGRKVDARKILHNIQRNRVRKYGKLHESLYDHLRKVGSTKPVEIAVWLDSPDPMRDRPRIGRGWAKRPPLLVRRQRFGFSKETARFKLKLKDKYATTKADSDPLAPVIYTKMDRLKIARIARLKEVKAIFLHETDGIDDLDDSIAIANSDNVHTKGYKGAGVKVAVWENGPDLTNKLVIEEFYDSTQAIKSWHSRHTHAIIKNKETGTPNGHAPSCTLYSANKKELDAIKWAAQSKGCSVISQSFHRPSEPKTSTLSFDDIYKDWLALNWPYPTILQAAGNYWNGDYDNITPPSSEYVNHKGYNSLAVGNHNDSASAMSASSVFRNPSTPRNDRELPEICANGMGVSVVDLTLSGTSMSAPAAAGVVAQIQSQKSQLKYWPEGCRAILLAGARRNVVDDTWWRDLVANVDASDGSGAVDALESHWITKYKRTKNASATLRGWDVGSLTSSNFGSDKMSTFSYKVKLPSYFFSPRHVKVALAWSSKVSTISLMAYGEIPISSVLSVDLDLKIYDSYGRQVGYSGSWDNSYEIAEFDGKPGETYTIKIRRWSGTDKVYYGIAWTVTGGLWFTSHAVRKHIELNNYLTRTYRRRRIR